MKFKIWIVTFLKSAHFVFFYKIYEIRVDLYLKKLVLPIKKLVLSVKYNDFYKEKYCNKSKEIL